MSKTRQARSEAFPMWRDPMRRIAVAVVIATLILASVGCGGNEGAQPAGGTAGGEAPAPPPGAAPAAEAPAEDRSATETVSFEPFPNSAEMTPDAISSRLKARQPMIVFFFEKAQKTSNDQRAEIDAVVKKYRGLIDLVAFDVSSTTAKGTEQTEAAKQLSRLINTLGVTFTPYVIIVDEAGTMTWRARGPVDKALLEREVLRATN